MRKFALCLTNWNDEMLVEADARGWTAVSLQEVSGALAWGGDRGDLPALVVQNLGEADRCVVFRNSLPNVRFLEYDSLCVSEIREDVDLTFVHSLQDRHVVRSSFVNRYSAETIGGSKSSWLLLSSCSQLLQGLKVLSPQADDVCISLFANRYPQHVQVIDNHDQSSIL